MKKEVDGSSANYLRLTADFFALLDSKIFNSNLNGVYMTSYRGNNDVRDGVQNTEGNKAR